MSEKPWWLRLMTWDGDHVLVAVSKLTAIADRRSGGAELWLQGNNEPMAVQESPVDILRLIDATLPRD